MKKTIIILLSALLVTTAGQAQHRHPTPERKFIYMTSVGYATGVGQIKLEQQTVKNINFDISVNQLLGYQFNPYFQMGLGAGFDFWKHTAFIPIYWNFTVNFTNTKVDASNGRHVIHGTKTGPMCDTGIGLRINLNEKLSLLLAVCYKNQHSKIYTVPDSDEQDKSASYSTNSNKDVPYHLYHFVGVRLGIQY